MRRMKRDGTYAHVRRLPTDAAQRELLRVVRPEKSRGGSDRQKSGRGYTFVRIDNAWKLHSRADDYKELWRWIFRQKLSGN